MFTGSALCVSWLENLMLGVHNHAVDGDVFKMALYTNEASIDTNTSVYTTSGEASGSGYDAGGVELTNVAPEVAGGVAFAQFANVVFPAVSVTARGAMIYNSSKGNKAVAVLDFGSDKTFTATDMPVTMPLFTNTAALLRISAA